MFGANRPAFGGASQPFGSTSSPFGSQQQQPGSTFGVNSGNNAQSGFGGFGAAQSTTAAANPGGSLFGMSSNNNSSNSPFGKTVTGGVGANTSGSLFGGGGLGSAGSSVPSMTGNAGSGTAMKPYVAYQEKDPTTGVMNVFESISAIPEYRNFSMEELRMQDYQAGRKFSTVSGNVTKTVSPFGAQTTNTNTGFGTIGNSNSMQPQSAGSGGLFGQRATTAQNSPFGSLSSSNNTNNTSNSFGSGAFGGNTNTNTGFGNTNNSPFGMNKPAAGGLFGQQPNSGAAAGGGFGQQNSTFGANNSSFGNTNNTGTTGGLFGQNTQQQAGGLFGNQQNNTFGQNNNQAGGLFGQNASTNAPGAFGQQNNQQSGGLFGNKPAAQGGLFGQQNNTFGSTNTAEGGLFGQNNNQQQPQTGSLFGQNTTSQQSGGLFGQNNPNQQSGGLFGQNNNQQQGSGGLFGQNNNQQGGLFGQSSGTQSTFGQPQTNTNAGLFGNKPSGSLFGQTQNNTGFGGANRTTGGGLFGQNNSQPSQGIGGGLFGQNNTQQQSGGLFGQNNNQPQQVGALGQNNQQQSGGLFGAKPANNTGGLFGNNQNSQGSGGLFGNNQQQQQPQGGGLFGQNNQQQQQPGGLFGSKPANSTGGGLFGNASNNQTALGQPSGADKPATGGTGLFGNNNANTSTNSMGGGLFGNNNPNTNANNTSGGLFGAKPQGAGTGGLFGNNQTNSSTSTGGLSGGLFGSKPASNTTTTLGGGLFGNNSSAANGTSGGLFGNKSQTGNQQLGFQGGFSQTQPAQQQQQQQPITNPYGTNELFSRIPVPSSVTQPTKPSATKVNADMKKKASLSSAYRLAPKPLFASRSLSGSPVIKSDKLLTMNSRASSAASNPTSAGKELTPSDAEATLFSSKTDEDILSADKLLFNPDRKSFKNLIINRKKMEEDSEIKQIRGEPRKITFSSNASEAQKNATASTDGDEGLFDHVHDSPTVNKEFKKKPKANDFLNSSNTVQSSEAQSKEVTQAKPRGIIGDDISFTDDGYYISPSLDALASKTLPQLRKVSGLVIGHKDYGKIEFLEPVDLSNTPLPLLCGKIICFEPRACIAYPNSTNPPAEGEGINVRARISLYKCFPSDKATREPIKDANHQLVKRHIEKMKRQKQAKFESYDPVTGCWTFVVQHPAY